MKNSISSLPFQNISILVVLMFGWQINANLRRYQDLGDVYYGEKKLRANEMIIYNFSISINSNLINVVFISFHANVFLYTSPPPWSRRCRDVDWLGIQIAQIAIIATQFSMAILSVVLIIGIHSVSIIDSLLVVGWICDWLPCQEFFWNFEHLLNKNESIDFNEFRLEFNWF